MKTPNIPKGLHAHFYRDDDTGLTTLCVLEDSVDGHPVGRSTGYARYNPNDYSDPMFPFDPHKGRAIALKRAIRNYNKGWW